MKLYSTNGVSPSVGFEEAIFRGLPPDNGLYMPTELPVLPQAFWDNVQNLSFNEIAFEVANAFLKDEIPAEDLREIISQAFDFDAPLVKLSDNLYCLELFHGPSMAFKDFGARFMAATMSYFLKKTEQKINILVATSGDTGGAVALGFHKVPNISVTILYPKGKVSDIQEKQLTTLGENIKALEVAGTFDDCQALVKQAFLDEDLRSKFTLASANSINIARLIPQAFYYVYAYAQIRKTTVYSVPSGNFGNLTAGLFARSLGMPVQQFIAATNVNNVVPTYLESGFFEPISPSKTTISNAMDVGNPSNFPRLKAVFGGDITAIRASLKGYYFTDAQTRDAVKELYEKYGYLACPHTAVAYLGLKQAGYEGIFLSTAHYGKFLPEMESILGFTPEVPERLLALLANEKISTEISTEYTNFKSFLLDNLI